MRSGWYLLAIVALTFCPANATEDPAALAADPPIVEEVAWIEVNHVRPAPGEQRPQYDGVLFWDWDAFGQLAVIDWRTLAETGPVGLIVEPDERGGPRARFGCCWRDKTNGRWRIVTAEHHVVIVSREDRDGLARAPLGFRRGLREPD